MTFPGKFLTGLEREGSRHVGRDTFFNNDEVFKERFPRGKGVVFDQSSDSLPVQSLLNGVSISIR